MDLRGIIALPAIGTFQMGNERHREIETLAGSCVKLAIWHAKVGGISMQLSCFHWLQWFSVVLVESFPCPDRRTHSRGVHRVCRDWTFPGRVLLYPMSCFRLTSPGGEIRE